MTTKSQDTDLPQLTFGHSNLNLDSTTTKHRRVVSAILAHYSHGARFTADDCRQDLGLGNYLSWLLPFLVKLNYLECDRDKHGHILGYRVP